MGEHRLEPTQVFWAEPVARPVLKRAHSISHLSLQYDEGHRVLERAARLGAPYGDPRLWGLGGAAAPAGECQSGTDDTPAMTPSTAVPLAVELLEAGEIVAAEGVVLLNYLDCGLLLEAGEIVATEGVVLLNYLGCCLRTEAQSATPAGPTATQAVPHVATPAGAAAA